MHFAFLGDSSPHGGRTEEQRVTGMQDFFGRAAAAPDRVVLVMAETGARFTAASRVERH